MWANTFILTKSPTPQGGREAGAVSAAGTAAQRRPGDRCAALPLVWLEVARQRESLVGHLSVQLDQRMNPRAEGRKANSTDGVEPWNLLLLLDLVSEALDFSALHFNNSPHFFLLVQSHGGSDAVGGLAGPWKGQSRMNGGLSLDGSMSPLPPFLPPQSFIEHLLNS